MTDLYVPGSLIVEGTSTLDGKLVARADFAVTGFLRAAALAAVAPSSLALARVTQDLVVDGDVSFGPGAAMDVSGTITVDGVVRLDPSDSSVVVGGALSVAGDVVFEGTSNQIGAISVATGASDFQGSTSVLGSVTVGGAALFGGRSVTSIGAVHTPQGYSAVVGAFSVEAPLIVDGATAAHSMSSNLYVCSNTGGVAILGEGAPMRTVVRILGNENTKNLTIRIPDGGAGSLTLLNFNSFVGFQPETLGPVPSVVDGSSFKGFIPYIEFVQISDGNWVATQQVGVFTVPP